MPEILNMKIVDEIVHVGNKESFKMTKRLTKEELFY